MSTPTAERRKAAQAFLADLGMAGVIEDALNGCCQELPRDPFGYVAERLRQRSHATAVPEVTKVTASEIYSADGAQAMQVEVYCNHHGLMDHLCAKAQVTKAKDDGIGSAIAVGGADQAAAVPNAGGTQVDTDEYTQLTSDVMKGTDPRGQAAVDELLLLGAASRITYAGSLAMLKAGAFVSEVPPYRRMADLASVELSAAGLPTPALSAIRCRGSGGKANVRSIEMVAPAGVPLEVGLRTLVGAYRMLQANIATKYGAAAAAPGADGAFQPPKMDKIEAALDLVKEACASCDETAPGIVLNIDSTGCWNGDKGKYELVKGSLKTPEDVVKDLANMCKNYPMIQGFVQPFKAEHGANLSQLMEGLVPAEGYPEYSSYDIGTEKLASDRALPREWVAPEQQEEAATALFATIDNNGSGNITYKEFMKWLAKAHPLLVDEKAERKAIEQAFKMNTMADDQDNCISPPEFKDLFRNLWGTDSDIPKVVDGNGVFITTSTFETVTQLARASMHVRTNAQTIYFSAVHEGELHYDLAADIAVGSGATIFHLGGPGGASAETCNRLVAIAAELSA